MMHVDKITADIEHIAQMMPLSPDILNADIGVDRDAYLGLYILRIKASVLSGVPRKITATVHAPTTVRGAVLAYWIAPALEWIGERTRWDWPWTAKWWCKSLLTAVTETSEMNTRMCPHLLIPDDRRHFEWVNGEGR